MKLALWTRLWEDSRRAAHPSFSRAWGQLALVFALLPSLPVVAGARTANDLGPLQIQPERVPDWYVIDHRPDTSSWTLIDMGSQPSIDAAVGPGCSKPDPRDGSGDGDQSDIQCVLDRLDGSGTVLLFPAGTYNFSGSKESGIDIVANNVVLRGVGKARTIFKHHASEGDYTRGCIGRPMIGFCRASESRTAYTWSGGKTRGSTLLEFANTSGLSPGDWLWLVNDQPAGDDPKVSQCAKQGEANECIGYMAQVVSKTSSSVRIDRGLRHDFNLGRARAYKLTNIGHGGGVEHLSIIGLQGGWSGGAVAFENWAYGWLNRLEIDGRGQAGNHIIVLQNYSARHLILDNYIHDFCNGDCNTTGHRTIDVAKRAYDNMVIGNWAHNMRNLVEVQLGATGNVVAYNHYGTRQQGCTFRNFFQHGDWAHENLWEGNTSERCRHMDYDSFWGHQGPRNTFYANEHFGGCNSTDSAGSCNRSGSGPNILFRSHADGNRVDGKGLIGRDLNLILNAGGDITGGPGCGSTAIGGCVHGVDELIDDGHYERNFARGVVNFDRKPDWGSQTYIDNVDGRRTRATTAGVGDWDRFCADPELPRSLINNGGEDSLNVSTPPFFWCEEIADMWDKSRGVGACGADFGGPMPRRVSPAIVRKHGGSCTPSAGAPPRPPRSPTPPATPPAPPELL